MALTKTPIELSSTPGIVDNSNATAITIDASENVTFAGTATAVGLAVTSSSSNAGTFKAVGGYALQAYQDATSANHTALELRSDHVSGGTDRYLIRGYNTAAGTPAESFNVNTAGGAYFAGGAYLGGTGAANKLEDYETGVWTPVDQNGNAYTPNVQASYTKIGRLVYFNFDISSTAVTTGSFVYGLPFPALAAAVSGNWSVYTGYSTSNADITGHINASSSKISIYVGSTAHTLSGRWMGAGSYYAA